MLTNEQREAYVRYGGNKCPHCGGDNLYRDGGTHRHNSGAWECIRCDSCKRYWKEVL